MALLGQAPGRPVRQAAVLCGGLGSRLGALTADTPKPLLEVAGEPFLGLLLRELVRQGVRRILLLAAFRSAMIEAFARDFAPELGRGAAVEVVTEPGRAGTAGALFNARHALEESFFLLNGDSWLGAPLADLAAEAEAAPDLAAVMALRPLPDAGRFGVVTLEGGRVTAFRAGGAAGPGLVNGGVYLMRRAALEGLPAEGSLEQEHFPRLAAAGVLGGRIAEGPFIDIGVPEDFARAQGAIPAWRRKPALFLDRDGTLNVDHGHVGSVGRFAWIAGARETVRLANRLGFYVFVVTNQAGIGRGLYGEADYQGLMAHMDDGLAEIGAHLDDLRHAPWHPEAEAPWRSPPEGRADWRKPGPGMILDLMRRWPVDRARSLLLGDRETDMAAARAAGVAGHLFPGGDLLGFAAPLLEAAARGPQAGRA